METLTQESTNQSMELAVLSTDEVSNKIIITFEGEDYIKDLSTFGLNQSMTDVQIIERMMPSMREQFPSLTFNTTSHKVKRTTSGNIYLIPNLTAG